MHNTSKPRFTYPAARKDDVVEDYHGTPVADPFRWMEQLDAPTLQEWVEAENQLTHEFLAGIPEREAIKARLTELWNYPKYSVPRRRDDRLFFSKNDGLQNQFVLYVQDDSESEARVLLDPNTFSTDGTIALSNQALTHDGALLAYGVSSSGSDWQELRVRRVDTGEDYAETIRWCKFAGIGWRRDNTGFFYDRYPQPGSVPPEDESKHNQVYWHALDTDQSMDTLVYERTDALELGFTPFVTYDGAYLMLRVWHGTDPVNRVYYRPIDSDVPFVRLLDEADAQYDFIDNIGTTFFLHTDLEAPRGRIIAIDIEQPERANWREIVPQGEDVIAFVRLINNQFVVAVMRDAHHELRLYDLDGAAAGIIDLPTVGTISGLSGRREDSDMFLAFESFLYPTTILHFDFATAELNTYRAPEITFDPSAYQTEQVFYTSKDGTRVPMFLTYKRGLVRNGANPTQLYGYGGFNVNILPTFSVSRLVWLEHGGVLAVANLRGGGEYGEEWHQTGMLERKQNVFDDFIAAGEWLIAQSYTTASKLSIIGGSNGGLLVAACMLQRPDLFGAVICQVPVADMLRYHRFTVGRYWVGEYGNAEANPEHFRFLYAYSPLHNVTQGATYPPILITTADTDDRVVPAHSKKFAAALQAADSGAHPILLRVETKAGHGAGKPTAKVIEEVSDVYAFLFEVLK